jgi:hypothetical protein
MRHLSETVTTAHSNKQLHQLPRLVRDQVLLNQDLRQVDYLYCIEQNDLDLLFSLQSQ